MRRSSRPLPIRMLRSVALLSALLSGLLWLTYYGDNSSSPTGPSAPSADVSPQISESADAAQSQGPDDSLGGAFAGLNADVKIDNGFLLLPPVCLPLS